MRTSESLSARLSLVLIPTFLSPHLPLWQRRSLALNAKWFLFIVLLMIGIMPITGCTSPEEQPEAPAQPEPEPEQPLQPQPPPPQPEPAPEPQPEPEPARPAPAPEPRPLPQPEPTPEPAPPVNLDLAPPEQVLTNTPGRIAVLQADIDAARARISEIDRWISQQVEDCWRTQGFVNKGTWLSLVDRKQREIQALQARMILVLQTQLATKAPATVVASATPPKPIPAPEDPASSEPPSPPEGPVGGELPPPAPDVAPVGSLSR